MLSNPKYFQILDEIFTIVELRKKNKKSNSYTSKLFKRGKNRIAQKVLEESSELVIDYLNGSKKRTIEEVSHLLFHTIVLLSDKKITPKQVAKELKSRIK